MPFQPKLLTTIPAAEPDVKILFNGQLILRSEDGVTCDVGVNPLATNHELTIEVRIKTRGKDDQIRMRHIGPLHLRDPEGMLIAVAHDPAPVPASWKCVTPNPIDFEQEQEPVPPLDSDFRWILNLEGRLFHDTTLDPPIFETKNVIRLQDGEYFFRTAALSPGRLEYRRSGGGKNRFTFRRIGTTASASVFLVNQQQVVLHWSDDTKLQTLTLEKTPDTTYEIYVQNTPLFQVSPPESELEKFEELVEYYKVIPLEDDLTPFRLVPAIHPDGDGNEGSPDIPCQVITLDGPGG